MKRRSLLKSDDAGLTAYAMILLGMTIMLFLFGFTTMWNIYTDVDEGGARVQGTITDETSETNTVDTIDITSPELNLGVRIFNLIANSIFATLVGTVTVVGAFVIIFLFRKNSAVWQFVIPILLLIVLNVFVFPIGAIQGDMAAYDAAIISVLGLGFTTFLLVFFNLFYILAVIEFIRGTPT